MPLSTAEDWRERWAAEAARFGQSPLPGTFDDPPNAGLPVSGDQLAAEERSRETASLVRRIVVPRLLREARDRGWWDVDHAASPSAAPAAAPSSTAATVVADVTADTWTRLALAPRVVAPADAAAGHALVLAAIRDGAAVSAAIAGDEVVGLALAGPKERDGHRDLLALGVAPTHRRGGLATQLLAACPADRAAITLAERDPIEPLDADLRGRIASALLSGAGFTVARIGGAVGWADPSAVEATRPVVNHE
jgi:GNAT superfamily N-acetyltransferase